MGGRGRLRVSVRVGDKKYIYGTKIENRDKKGTKNKREGEEKE